MILFFTLICFGCCAYVFGPTALILYLLFIVLPLFLFLGSSLSDQELQDIDQRKQERDLKARYRFRNLATTPSVPRGYMKASGQFYDWEETISSFPATVAANWLKYKKHEWIIIGFVQGNFVKKVWANKGVDRSSVSSGITAAEVLRIAGQNDCTDIISMHNHPNSNSRLYSCNTPSPQDLESANYWSNVLTRGGLNFVDFICETGKAYPYYWAKAGHKELSQEELNRIRKGMSFYDNLEVRMREIFVQPFV